MAMNMKTSITLSRLPKRDGDSVPRSQTERLWLISGGLIAFVMLLIGYFFFISPQRSETTDVNGRVADAQQQNAVLQGRIDALREQSNNLPQYLKQLDLARLALPSQSGISDFVRTLQSLGSATSTDVTALTVGEPQAVTQPVAVTPVAGTASSVPVSSPTSAAPAAGSTASPAAAAPFVYSMSITATVTGSPNGLGQFLDQLQSVQPRAVLITELSESSGTASSTPGKTSLQLTMQAFLAPTPQLAATVPATGTTPSATSTATS